MLDKELSNEAKYELIEQDSQLESPFLNEEVLVSAEAETTKEWFSGQMNRQLESPFQSVFDCESELTFESQVEEPQLELYDDEGDLDEYEFSEEEYEEPNDLSAREYGEELDKEELSEENKFVEEIDLENEVIGKDTRKYVGNTKSVPFKWICSLELYFEEPDYLARGVQKWRLARKATGILIGPALVLTVAHNLWDIKNKRKFQHIVVTPGRNGKGAPFGSVEADAWVTHKRWKPNGQPSRWDFAVIGLKDSIGHKRSDDKTLGWWGSQKWGEGSTTKPINLDWLKKRKSTVRNAGYPVDKCGMRNLPTEDDIKRCTDNDLKLWASTQWYGRGSVENINSPAGFLFHTIDTTGGHSGAPIWYYYYDKKRDLARRWLVGLHTGGEFFKELKRTLNHSVWLSKDVWKSIATMEVELEKKIAKKKEFQDEEYDLEGNKFLENLVDEESFNENTEGEEAFVEKMVDENKDIEYGEFDEAEDEQEVGVTEEHSMDEVKEALEADSYSKLDEYEFSKEEYEEPNDLIVRDYDDEVADNNEFESDYFDEKLNDIEQQASRLSFNELDEYIFSDEEVKDDYELIEYENSFNVSRAIRKNRYWAKKLKWRKDGDRIKSFLMSMFPHISIKTEKGFAQAVEMWQLFMEDDKPDGILGPKTWATLRVQIANIKKTVSPSQISSTGVDNLLKNIFELSIDIYEAEYDILNAWETGLTQFYVVIKSASDAEISSNFRQVLQKHIKTSLINTLASAIPLGAGTHVVGIVKTLNEEQARIKYARDSAMLRDFIIDFSSELRKYKKVLRNNKADYIAQVRINYENMDKNQRASYRMKLASHISNLDKQRRSGWLNISDTFKKIAFAWIRYSKVKDVIKRGTHESLVQVSVNIEANRSLVIKKVKIHAPGGDKIAEQLIKNARNGGVRLSPYLWPVFRKMVFYRNSSWAYASGWISSKGFRVSSRTYNPGIAHTLFKRMLANKPTTMNVK